MNLNTSSSWTTYQKETTTCRTNPSTQFSNLNIYIERYNYQSQQHDAKQYDYQHPFIRLRYNSENLWLQKVELLKLSNQNEFRRCESFVDSLPVSFRRRDLLITKPVNFLFSFRRVLIQREVLKQALSINSFCLPVPISLIHTYISKSAHLPVVQECKFIMIW